MTDRALRQEAEQLYEERLGQLREEAYREQEEEKERGIRQAISDIQEQRDQERMAQARLVAKEEATMLAIERHELESRIEDEADALTESMAELAQLDAEQRRALQAAGTPPNQHWLVPMLRQWFAERFGGRNSLSGIKQPIHRDPRSLPERDAMSRAPNTTK